MSGSLNPLAVITGASSGLGMSYARQLAAMGCDLMLVARRKFVLDSLKDELERQYGVAVEVVPADLAKLEDIRMLEEKIRTSPRLFYMVNNAGFGVEGDFPEKSTDMIAVHCTATMRLSRAAMIPMQAKKKGHIINVASAAGFMAMQGAADYCATKAFIISFSRCLQCDGAADGIHVQALCPGFVRTGFHDAETMAGNEIKKQTGAWMWLKADWVVKKSLRQVQKNCCRSVAYIPSLRYKILTQLASGPLVAPLRRFFSGGKMQ